MTGGKDRRQGIVLFVRHLDARQALVRVFCDVGVLTTLLLLPFSLTHTQVNKQYTHRYLRSGIHYQNPTWSSYNLLKQLDNEFESCLMPLSHRPLIIFIKSSC